MAAKAPATLERVSGIPVKVAGQTVFISKLTLDQWVEITQLAIASVLDDKSKQAEALKALQNIPTWTDASVVLRVLNADTIAGLYSVITGIDAETLRNTFDMAEFVNVVAALRETGELSGIADAFSRAVKGWSPLSETSSQPSATSASTEATASAK